MLTLDVLISTLGRDGISRVAQMRLPEIDGVGYIVSWQEPDGLPVPPELASRPDVRIYPLGGRGLSRNRNNALDHSTADIRLIADDDLRYTPDGLRAVIAAFERSPEVDIACFRYDGADAKTYPSRECRLTTKLPKDYYLTSFEMAIRNRGEASRLRYDERFGLGSGCLPLGEEEELFHRAVRHGLVARFFPVNITTHPGLTTGNRPMSDPRALRARGAVIALYYPLSWTLRIPLVAWRERRKGRAPFLGMLFQGFRGALWRFFRYRR